MTVVAMVPLMGGLAIAVDFGEMNRQKQTVANALDAAGIATARQVVSGASETQLIAYAKSFFEANLGSVDPADTVLTVTLPSNQAGGGTLKLSARLDYKPIFFPVFAELSGNAQGSGTSDISFTTKTEIRLKNTLEVALVLDNSGSMSNVGSGSSLKRIDLLKTAAKQLVDTLSQQAALIKQIDKPVQFSLVPFAASVNVGPQNAGASWMDADGLSPVHQENFDWSVMSTGDKRAEKINGMWYKKGTGWGEDENKVADALLSLQGHAACELARVGGDRTGVRLHRLLVERNLPQRHWRRRALHETIKRIELQVAQRPHRQTTTAVRGPTGTVAPHSRRVAENGTGTTVTDLSERYTQDWAANRVRAQNPTRT